MNTFNHSTLDLQTELDQHKNSLEHFIINGMTNLRTGLTQREQAINELVTENETMRNQLAGVDSTIASMQATIDARDASLTLATSQITELEQRLASLNAGIDAAQAGA